MMKRAETKEEVPFGNDNVVSVKRSSDGIFVTMLFERRCSINGIGTNITTRT